MKNLTLVRQKFTEKRRVLSVLVIEFDMAFAGHLSVAMDDPNYSVDYSCSWKQAFSLLEHHYYDVVVLSVDPLDAKCVDFYQDLNELDVPNIPILHLDKTGTVESMEAAFLLGANDYLQIPFKPSELLLRISALSRRERFYANQQKKVSIGDVTLRKQNRSLVIGENNKSLSRIQFELLNILFDAYPDPVRKEVMVNKVWGAAPPESGSLKVHIYHLRRWLKANSCITIEGDKSLGYRLMQE